MMQDKKCCNELNFDPNYPEETMPDAKHKYKKPDKRCTFPYSNCPAGYCWWYANSVDTGVEQDKIIEACKECEYWEENQKMTIRELKERKLLIEYTDNLREYIRESGNDLSNDERESSEFVDMFLKNKKQEETINEI